MSWGREALRGHTAGSQEVPGCALGRARRRAAGGPGWAVAEKGAMRSRSGYASKESQRDSDVGVRGRATPQSPRACAEHHTPCPSWLPSSAPHSRHIIRGGGTRGPPGAGHMPPAYLGSSTKAPLRQLLGPRGTLEPLGDDLGERSHGAGRGQTGDCLPPRGPSVTARDTLCSPSDSGKAGLLCSRLTFLASSSSPAAE